MGVKKEEGSLLTRSRWSADMQMVGPSQVVYPEEDWYLLETNYDYWKEPGDGRRAAGRNGIEWF